MAYRYRRRRRRNRTRVAVVLTLALLSCIFLVSCMASANVLWVRALLGFDVTDYEGEETVATHTGDGELALELCEMVHILSDDRGVYLSSFHDTEEAVDQYRDAILGYMLRNNYSRYTGNRAELDRAEQAYPQMTVTTLIPQSDFENTVYRYFGGTTVKNKSGSLYSYLKKADCYTAPVSVSPRDVEIDVQSLEETEHTYRMRFVLSEGEETSGVYTAVFVKRDDGSCYFRSLVS